MERVEFLIEETHQRVPCLLNPEKLTIDRSTGVQRAGGQLINYKLSDDPVYYSGRGSTSFQLELLFDVNLPDSFIQTKDVRELTQPLWLLTEYVRANELFDELPRVRFIWGKAWNIPVVISSISQQFDNMTRSGIPERALLNMSLLRVSENFEISQPGSPFHPTMKDVLEESKEQLNEPTAEWGVHILLADERLEQISSRYYGSPFYWRVIANANNIVDPLNIPVGTPLRIPPLRTIL